MTTHSFFRWLGRSLIPNIGTLVIVALMLAYQQATAQTGTTTPYSPPLVTNTFAYQGFLTNSTGQPINGNRALTFRLYDVATGGTALWTEVRNTVPVENGLFDVKLGEIVPIPASVWNTPNLYLGVQVESEVELLPREAIGLVPVAQRAITADLALTVPDASVTSEKLNPTVEQIILDDYIELTNEPQTILTTTFSVSYSARLLVITTLDMGVSNTFATGEIRIDNQPLNSRIIIGDLSGASNSGRGTVANTAILDIQPGTHEIAIRADLFDPSPGSGYIQPQSSNVTYLIFSQ